MSISRSYASHDSERAAVLEPFTYSRYEIPAVVAGGGTIPAASIFSRHIQTSGAGAQNITLPAEADIVALQRYIDLPLGACWDVTLIPALAGNPNLTVVNNADALTLLNAITAGGADLPVTLRFIKTSAAVVSVIVKH